MTEYEQYYGTRYDDARDDNRSEGGYESEAASYWRGAGGSDNGGEVLTEPNTRSNSVVSAMHSADVATSLAALNLAGEMPREGEPNGRETLLLMLDRWKKLHKDIYNSKTDSFDLSKVPDVHDNIR